jgi:rubrerythrin
MRFEQVRDVLEYARTVHRQLSEFYKNLGEQAEKERVKMLCDYMSRHEKHLEESLADYEDGAAENVLNTWFQFAPSEEMFATLRDFKVTPALSVDQVVRLAMEVDDCLINYYRTMAESADTEEVREIFNNLVSMEEHEKVRFARNALRLEDL